MCDTDDPEERTEKRPRKWWDIEGLGQALEALRQRKGWSVAEAARLAGIAERDLIEYEGNLKPIKGRLVDRIVEAYGSSLAELSAILKEVQSGPAVLWIVPKEVSEADLKLVTRMVLGKKWLRDDDEDDEPEEETLQVEDPPDGGEDDG